MVVQSSNGTYNFANHTQDNFAVVLTRPPGIEHPGRRQHPAARGPRAASMRAGRPAVMPWRDITNETQVVACQSVSSGTSS